MNINDTKIYQVALPAPSQQIKDLMTGIYEKFFVNPNPPEPKNPGSDLFVSNLYNLSAGYDNLALSRLVRQEYGQYFPGKQLAAYYGFMVGDYATTGIRKRYPVHIDSSRDFTLSYYFNLGGDNVTTILYDRVGGPAPRNPAWDFTEQDVTALGHTKFDTDKWYLWAVKQAHSIENIESVRSFLSITVLPDDSERVAVYENSTEEYHAFRVKNTGYSVDDVLSALSGTNIGHTQIALTPL